MKNKKIITILLSILLIFSIPFGILAAVYVYQGGTGLSSITQGYVLIGGDTYSLQATSSMFIDTTGYIGIATTSPTSLLSVGTTLGSQFLVDGSGNVTIEGTASITATTTLQDDLLLQDDKILYFDTAKTYSIEYDSNYGMLRYRGGFPGFAASSSVYIYANAGDDGGGSWEPFISLDSAGTISMDTTGLRIRTGDSSAYATIKADLIGSNYRTYHLPLASQLTATFLMATGTQDILTTGHATTSQFYASTFGLNSEYFTDLTGTGLSNTSNALTVALVTSGSDGDSTTTSTDSGLEFISSELSMIRGCADGEVILWDETNDYWECGAAAGGATIELDNLGTVAINTSLISDTDSTDDLGSSSKFWKYLYVDRVYLSANTLFYGPSYMQFIATNYIRFQIDGSIAYYFIYGTTKVFYPSDDSEVGLGNSTHFWDETYTDELVLSNAGTAATAADTVRLGGFDLSAGDAGLLITSEDDTNYIFGSKAGFGTTTPAYFMTIDGNGSATTTVSVGTGGSVACLMLRDTDLAGWTYCRVLDGTMTCNNTNPCE